MPTRRETLATGTLAALSLAGCMEQPGTNETTDDGADGGADDTTGDADGGADGGTDTETDGETTDGSDGDVSATVSTDWDPETITITVTLDDVGDADHVDVAFSGDAKAEGRLYEEGDAVALSYDGFETMGRAENLGFQQEDGTVTLPNWGSEVRVVATAVRGDASATVLDETDYIGDEFVKASVAHLFDAADDRVRVVLQDAGTADRVEVEFRGDAFATGRLYSENDELRLTADGLQTLGDAEVTTEEGRFDGAQDGDTVRVTAIAVRMTPDGERVAAQNIVTEKTETI